jgi:PAS domain S-box-containing protein
MTTNKDLERPERAESLLAAIVDSSDDAIVSKNVDGTITSWNKSAERLFGYAAEEAIGRNISLIIPDDRRAEEQEILRKIRNGERVEHFETVRVRKDGTLREFSLTISPVRNATGEVIGASKIARDITEAKRMERELRQSEERLRCLSADLEAKVRMRMSELETRNNEILQQSEQLRELSTRLQLTQDEERRRIARDLHDSAGQLIASLGMNLARIRAGVQSNSEITNICEDAQNIIEQLNREIRTTSYLLHPPLLDESGLSGAIHWYIQGLKERGGLEVQLQIREDFGRLPADLELALFRVMQECLTNIHRHSGSRTATVRLYRSASCVSLEVQDHGKGISEEKLTAIRAQRGGVGIAGMRERVRHLGGAMEIYSDSSGTAFKAMIPLVESASAAHP